MNYPFGVKTDDGELTLAQLWKAKKASEKLAKQASGSAQISRKKAA